MSAVFSDCGKYRYRLERRIDGFDQAGILAVIMVNPSTADASKNDPTIRKCIGFAERRKYQKLVVGNLFAGIATDIYDLPKMADPIGPGNDVHLREIMQAANRVMVAWGTMAKLPVALRGRPRQIAGLLVGKPLWCWGVNGDGHPKHPLYVPYDTKPEIWTPP